MTYTIYTKAEGKVIAAALGHGRTIDTLEALSYATTLNKLRVKDKNGRIWEADEFYATGLDITETEGGEDV